LLLEQPPREPPPPTDFRRVPPQQKTFSPNLRLAIRRARRLQRVAGEMSENLGLGDSSDIQRATRSEDPEEVGKRQRQSFRVGVDEQRDWKDPLVAFREWRSRIEARNILVFQVDVPRDETQGFSLSVSRPYAIVVSSKDAASARCFTLFHELGHLLLREEGICRLENGSLAQGDDATDAEDWCNRFAEAFLVDADALQSRPETKAMRNQHPGNEQDLRKLASFFHVSQHVLLFRMWHLDLISRDQFWTEYRRVAEGSLKVSWQPSQGKGGPQPPERTVQERGRLFTRLVLEGLERQVLSYTDAIDYLGLRLKHFDRLHQLVYG